MDAMTDKSATQDALINAAMELAQYASYAEIIGGVRENRAPIRKWCDEVFRLNNALRSIQDAEEDAAAVAAN